MFKKCRKNNENEEAHVDSYLRSDLWGKYDVTGTKYGSAKLILDLSTQTFYHAPNIV